jgi:hypothetical protein
MDLAFSLGKTVKELLLWMDSAELGKWMAYQRIRGPLGPVRDDIRTAIAGRVVLAAAGCKKLPPLDDPLLNPFAGLNKKEPTSDQIFETLKIRFKAVPKKREK